MGHEEWDKLADYDLGRIANALESIAKSLEAIVAALPQPPGQLKSLAMIFGEPI
jgi:hypothetical protein